ncbi:MAG: IS3 family transposase [Desulfomonilaceae bacterium]
MHDKTPLPVERKCELLSVPRSSYYRHRKGPESQCQERDEVYGEVEKICGTMHRYGYRRVTAELHRRGITANHKRILALMRRNNLLCRRKKKYRVATTNSNHAYRVYPNLVKGMEITRTDQVWISDITYIRLPNEFVYLAVVLDAFSRKAIGWALQRHLDVTLSLNALKMAIATRTVAPGLIHHSDRGVQYAATEYTDVLKGNKIAISMSRPGNPYDNAKAESFMKTLKHEEVLINEYETIGEARKSIANFIDEVYNRKRLHSSLGYMPPVEFENVQLTKNISTLNGQIDVSF